MRLECCHADTCLPDYWGGHHLPHVQIPVHRGMTLKEVKDSIRHELSHGYVMGSTETAYLLRADWVPPEKEKAAGKAVKAAYAAVNRIRPARKGQRRFFMDLPSADDSELYAYFVFVEG